MILGATMVDTTLTMLLSTIHLTTDLGDIKLLLPSKKRQKRKRQLNGDTVHITPTPSTSQQLATTNGALLLSTILTHGNRISGAIMLLLLLLLPS